MTENSGSVVEQIDDYLEDEDTQKDKYLTFRLGDEDYGIEIRHVTEIIGIQKITEIPNMPTYVKGIINLRGKVIPVIDVRSRFNLEKRAYDDRTCIVVVNMNENSVGLVVDTVNEVADIPEAQIEDAPKVTSISKDQYIQGLGKVDDKVKILLDVSKLLYGDEMKKLQNIQ